MFEDTTKCYYYAGGLLFVFATLHRTLVPKAIKGGKESAGEPPAIFYYIYPLIFPSGGVRHCSEIIVAEAATVSSSSNQGLIGQLICIYISGSI